jgi:hypothetical protein
MAVLKLFFFASKLWNESAPRSSLLTPAPAAKHFIIGRRALAFARRTVQIKKDVMNLLNKFADIF